MSYADLLRDPRWQKKRLEVFERAMFMCELCAANDVELHAHHRYYVKGRKPWEYDLADLMCLCKHCHQDITDRTAEMHRLVGLMDPYTFNRVFGYVLAALSWREPGTTLRVRSEIPGESEGIGDYFGVPGEIVDLLARDTGTVDRITLQSIARAVREQLDGANTTAAAPAEVGV